MPAHLHETGVPGEPLNLASVAHACMHTPHAPCPHVPLRACCVPPCMFLNPPPFPSLQRHGTEVDRKAALGHKPLGVKDGSQIKFGTHPNSFVLRCESSGK